MDFLEQAQAGGPVSGRVVLVLAHPDDETASAGGLLQRLAPPTLIYLTDGAPRDLIDARREGFSDWSHYARHRKAELREALTALAVRAQPMFYDYPDKAAHDFVAHIVDRLTVDLAGADVVITHPYEHGHPDHDTAAFTVVRACGRLGNAAPERVEFAGYHLGEHGPVYGQFFDGDGVVLQLSAEQRERKLAALAAYASQAGTLRQFPVEPERFRRAPDYDFTAPAPPGRALYDLYGWEVTSSRWRSRLAEVVE